MARGSRSLLVAGLAAAALAALPAAAAGFDPAPRGCAMSHCDVSMSDAVGMPAPLAASTSWFDPAAASAAQGLGCSSNGTLAACTFGDRTGARGPAWMKIYDAGGQVLWDSGETLNSWAWTSTPMVDQAGGVIAADDQRLVRFAPGGAVAWSTPTPGGAPISPTRTANGTIVLATAGGPVSAYDPATGERLATLDLTDTLDGLHGRFDTTNTPGASGNRIYVSTQFTLDDGSADPNHHARLYAIDVDPSKPEAERLDVAWYFEFGARSGASPLVVGDAILFDGDRETPAGPSAPRFFALRDEGAAPQLLWQYPLGGPGVASAALDPRGGAWVFAFGNPLLRRISLADGSLLQTIDLDALVGAAGTHAAYSAMSIATGPAGQPVMLVTARAGIVNPTSVHVVAVDLEAGSALWSYEVPGDPATNTPMGQFPVLAGPDGSSVTVFSMKAGIRAISDAEPARPAFERKLTLRHSASAHRFQGRLESPEPACRLARVKLMRKRGGHLRRVGADRANARGRWRVKRRAGPGAYFARVERGEVTAGTCEAARSKRLRR